MWWLPIQNLWFRYKQNNGYCKIFCAMLHIRNKNLKFWSYKTRYDPFYGLCKIVYLTSWVWWDCMLTFYSFIYLSVRESKRTFNTDGVKEWQDQCFMSEYTFHIIIWQGISKKNYIPLEWSVSLFRTSSSLSGSAWHVSSLWWVEDGGCSL